MSAIDQSKSVHCPTCDSEGPFGLADSGKLACASCERVFNPEDPKEDPNEPRRTHGFDSDAVDPNGTETGTFWCPDCGKRVTRGPAEIEYGHRRKGDRCPRRPATVDPSDARQAGAYASHRAQGIGKFANEADD